MRQRGPKLSHQEELLRQIEEKKWRARAEQLQEQEEILEHYKHYPLGAQPGSDDVALNMLINQKEGQLYQQRSELEGHRPPDPRNVYQAAYGGLAAVVDNRQESERDRRLRLRREERERSRLAPGEAPGPPAAAPAPGGLAQRKSHLFGGGPALDYPAGPISAFAPPPPLPPPPGPFAAHLPPGGLAMPNSAAPGPAPPAVAFAPPPPAPWPDPSQPPAPFVPQAAANTPKDEYLQKRNALRQPSNAGLPPPLPVPHPTHPDGPYSPDGPPLYAQPPLPYPPPPAYYQGYPPPPLAPPPAAPAYYQPYGPPPNDANGHPSGYAAPYAYPTPAPLAAPAPAPMGEYAGYPPPPPAQHAPPPLLPSALAAAPPAHPGAASPSAPVSRGILPIAQETLHREQERRKKQEYAEQLKLQMAADQMKKQQERDVDAGGRRVGAGAYEQEAGRPPWDQRGSPPRPQVGAVPQDHVDPLRRKQQQWEYAAELKKQMRDVHGGGRRDAQEQDFGQQQGWNQRHSPPRPHVGALPQDQDDQLARKQRQWEYAEELKRQMREHEGPRRRGNSATREQNRAPEPPQWPEPDGGKRAKQLAYREELDRQAELQRRLREQERQADRQGPGPAPAPAYGHGYRGPTAYPEPHPHPHPAVPFDPQWNSPPDVQQWAGPPEAPAHPLPPPGGYQGPTHLGNGPGPVPSAPFNATLLEKEQRRQRQLQYRQQLDQQAEADRLRKEAELQRLRQGDRDGAGLPVHDGAGYPAPAPPPAPPPPYLPPPPASLGPPSPGAALGGPFGGVAGPGRRLDPDKQAQLEEKRAKQEALALAMAEERQRLDEEKQRKEEEKRLRIQKEREELGLEAAPAIRVRQPSDAGMDAADLDKRAKAEARRAQQEALRQAMAEERQREAEEKRQREEERRERIRKERAELGLGEGAPGGGAPSESHPTAQQRQEPPPAEDHSGPAAPENHAGPPPHHPPRSDLFGPPADAPNPWPPHPEPPAPYPAYGAPHQYPPPPPPPPYPGQGPWGAPNPSTGLPPGLPAPAPVIYMVDAARMGLPGLGQAPQPAVGSEVYDEIRSLREQFEEFTRGMWAQQQQHTPPQPAALDPLVGVGFTMAQSPAAAARSPPAQPHAEQEEEDELPAASAFVWPPDDGPLGGLEGGDDNVSVSELAGTAQWLSAPGATPLSSHRFQASPTSTVHSSQAAVLPPQPSFSPPAPPARPLRRGSSQRLTPLHCPPPPPPAWPESPAPADAGRPASERPRLPPLPEHAALAPEALKSPPHSARLRQARRPPGSLRPLSAPTLRSAQLLASQTSSVVQSPAGASEARTTFGPGPPSLPRPSPAASASVRSAWSAASSGPAAAPPTHPSAPSTGTSAHSQPRRAPSPARASPRSDAAPPPARAFACLRLLSVDCRDLPAGYNAGACLHLQIMSEEGTTKAPVLTEVSTDWSWSLDQAFAVPGPGCSLALQVRDVSGKHCVCQLLWPLPAVSFGPTVMELDTDLTDTFTNRTTGVICIRYSYAEQPSAPRPDSSVFSDVEHQSSYRSNGRTSAMYSPMERREEYSMGSTQSQSQRNGAVDGERREEQSDGSDGGAEDERYERREERSQSSGEEDETPGRGVERREDRSDSSGRSEEGERRPASRKEDVIDGIAASSTTGSASVRRRETREEIDDDDVEPRAAPPAARKAPAALQPRCPWRVDTAELLKSMLDRDARLQREPSAATVVSEMSAQWEKSQSSVGSVTPLVQDICKSRCCSASDSRPGSAGVRRPRRGVRSGATAAVERSLPSTSAWQLPLPTTAAGDAP